MTILYARVERAREEHREYLAREPERRRKEAETRARAEATAREVARLKAEAYAKQQERLTRPFRESKAYIDEFYRCMLRNHVQPQVLARRGFLRKYWGWILLSWDESDTIEPESDPPRGNLDRLSIQDRTDEKLFAVTEEGYLLYKVRTRIIYRFNGSYDHTENRDPEITLLGRDNWSTLGEWGQPEAVLDAVAKKIAAFDEGGSSA